MFVNTENQQQQFLFQKHLIGYTQIVHLNVFNVTRMTLAIFVHNQHHASSVTGTALKMYVYVDIQK